VEGPFGSAQAGDVIEGFRLERLLGGGETGVVFEATQLSLGRTVALRLIDPVRFSGDEARERLDRDLALASSVHHAGLVPVYEAGEWAGGRFVATRLVDGGTLGALRAGPSPAGAAEMLEPVAAGLEAAHRAGLSHGAIRAENVLVDRDGRAYLADLGLGRGDGADADRARLAALRETVESKPAARPRWWVLAAAAVAAAGAAVAAALLIGGGSGDGTGYAEEPAPAAPDGTVPLGNGLSPGPADAVGCGQRFGNTSACTIVPAGLDGGSLEVTEPAVIRAWAVRGATGELTLQVLRAQGPVTPVAGFSQPVEAPDPGPHAFPAEIGLRPGDLIAVRLGPGAELGRRGGGAGGLRWAGAELPLPPLSEATRVRGELLLRIDVEPGATPSPPPLLTGARALSAPTGLVLAESAVTVSARRAVLMRLVRTETGIQLDSFSGSRRIARLPLADLDPDGELVLFGQGCGHPRSACLRWRNPGEAGPVLHEVRVAPDGSFELIG
jgi:hypothetical protein